MKKKQLITFILAVTIALVFDSCGSDGGNGSQLVGGGTAANPYLISSKADFMAIGGGVDTNGKYYRLEADLVGTESITEPLGNASNKRFIGHFDGNGHTVNLNITGNHQNAGLFAAIGAGMGTIPTGAGWFNNAGTVKNLILTGTVNVSGDKVEYAGAVAGDIADIGSSIRGIASSVTVTISGPAANAGGIAGAADSGQDVPVEIENCYSTGNVSITNTSGGSVNAGGIAGNCAATTIRYCRASGAITASASSGGIPGYSGGIFGSSSLKTTGRYCVALSPSVSGDNPVNLSGVMMGGTFRVSSSFGTLGNNYANSTMTLNGSASSDNVLTDGNGGTVTLAATEAADWWRNTAGWSGKFGTSETAPWKWDNNSKRPVLWFE
jgi:hypothetical protein